MLKYCRFYNTRIQLKFKKKLLGEYFSCHIIFFLLFLFFNLVPQMSFTDFVVFPPGHGRSVTDFSGWDARLRCPDDVSGDIGGCNARRALKPNFY